jgi:hypothetical protein
MEIQKNCREFDQDSLGGQWKLKSSPEIERLELKYSRKCGSFFHLDLEIAILGFQSLHLGMSLLEGTTNSQSEYNGMHTNDNLLKIREYRT